MMFFTGLFESSSSSQAGSRSTLETKRQLPAARGRSTGGRNYSTTHQTPRTNRTQTASTVISNTPWQRSPFPLSNKTADLNDQKGICVIGMGASGGIALLSVVVLTGAAALLAFAGCAMAFIVSYDFFKRASNVLEQPNSVIKVVCSGAEVVASAIDGAISGEGFEASGNRVILEKQFEGALLKDLWVNLFKNCEF